MQHQILETLLLQTPFIEISLLHEKVSEYISSLSVLLFSTCRYMYRASSFGFEHFLKHFLQTFSILRCNLTPLHPSFYMLLVHLQLDNAIGFQIHQYVFLGIAWPIFVNFKYSCKIGQKINHGCHLWAILGELFPRSFPQLPPLTWRHSAIWLVDSPNINKCTY